LRRMWKKYIDRCGSDVPLSGFRGKPGSSAYLRAGVLIEQVVVK
jgi:hypothetical protein